MSFEIVDWWSLASKTALEVIRYLVCLAIENAGQKPTRKWFSLLKVAGTLKARTSICFITANERIAELKLILRCHEWSWKEP